MKLSSNGNQDSTIDGAIVKDLLRRVGGRPPADVAAALPARLNELDHDVRLFLPFYARIKQLPGLSPIPLETIRDVPVEIGWKTYSFSAHKVELPEKRLTAHLIDCPELFDRPEHRGQRS